MKKIVAASIIVGISLVMLFTTIGTAQLAESQENQEMCDILNQQLASATGERVAYIQQSIAQYCS